MRDVSMKATTLRTAEARSVLHLDARTVAVIHEGAVPKGDPLPVAKVAAIQAVKSTGTIIPYCHPILIEHVDVQFEIRETEILSTVRVTAIARTGVEMEAMTGASVAALTLYDMLKMIDEDMRIGEVTLLKKRGGKSQFRAKAPRTLRAAVLVMSDSVAAGEKSDTSGRMIQERLAAEGLEVRHYDIVPDDTDIIAQRLKQYADDDGIDLVLTTGGTGFSPRDCTPEAMTQVIEREIPGIPEAVRAYGQDRTPYAMLSRARAGIRGQCIIINLPGSRGGVADALDALFPSVIHSYRMLWMKPSSQHQSYEDTAS
jgi:cyclic pyranopterin phosphate synthase